jgi:hypothetical protein
VNFEVDEPEDFALPTAQLFVMQYIKKDGGTAWCFQTRGNGEISTYLGLTLIAQDELNEWRKEEEI